MVNTDFADCDHNIIRDLICSGRIKGVRRVCRWYEVDLLDGRSQGFATFAQLVDWVNRESP